MPNDRYDLATQAARSILERLPGLSEPEKHQPEVAFYVLQAMLKAEAPACPRGRRPNKHRSPRKA